MLIIGLALGRGDPYRATNCPVEAVVDAFSRPDRFLISDENNLKNKVKLLTLFGGNEITSGMNVVYCNFYFLMYRCNVSEH